MLRHRQGEGPRADRGQKKKLIDYSAWLSGVGRDSCQICQAAYAARSRPRPWDRKRQKGLKPPVVKKDPPCATCRPELDPANTLAVMVYSRCSDQWRGGESGFLTVDNMNVEVAMDAAGVSSRHRTAVFDDVKTIIGTIAGLIQNERQKQREKLGEQGKNGHSQNRSRSRR